MSETWAKFFDIDEELNAFKYPKTKGFSTKAIHVGQESEQWSSRATIPPIHVSATYTLVDQKDYVSFKFLNSRLCCHRFHFPLLEILLLEGWKSNSGHSSKMFR